MHVSVDLLERIMPDLEPSAPLSSTRLFWGLHAQRYASYRAGDAFETV